MNTFYTPSFYGKGFHLSGYINYKINKAFQFLVKFGETIYQDRDQIGSGNDLINSNKKTDIQMQLRIKI